MADLGAIEEDVRFDHAAADALIGVCEGAAGVIEGQAGSRASWRNTALDDFRGRFSQLFRSNASVAAADATELASRLREVAGFTRRLKEEAAKEQQRRETARAWKREQEERSLWDKGVDAVFGGDDPPVGPPAAEPTFPVSAPVSGTRETPSPGSGGGGGGGGGTSSARPADLRAFAAGSRGANQALASKPGACRSAYDDFRARCQWGSLEASGVFTGFDKYLAANEEDVRWATLVADAFAAAGGEGAVSTLADSALLATLQAAGVDAVRQDLVIDPPMAYGSPPTTGYANDPVNTATGNFLENEVDLGFPGAAAGLALTRTYNSFDTSVGAFGPGWSSWTEAHLELDDEAARMRLSDGRVVTFPRLGAGWDRARGESLWLRRTEDDVLRATDNTGRAWDFTPGGALLAVSAGEGTSISLVRDAGQLRRLEHARGRWVELVWDEQGERVTGATASDGRHVSYTYDESGRLTGVTGPAGTRTYSWDEAGLVDAVVDADGVVEAENTYDDHRRVATQRSPHGRSTRFAYLPGNVTVVSDADGSRSNTWLHDARGRLIGVVDAHEQRQSTSYDAHGNPVLITERDGATTVHEYDDRGRRTRTVTPTGADLTYGYDDLDRVTTVVAGSGAVTEYTYRGDDRNPSLMVDPEGGRTQLRWQGGLLVEVVDPVGVSVRFSYDDHGDLVATTDALGNTARLERDTTGRVRTAITPSGSRTSYSYAPSGVLASRRDPDGAVWRYEHTAAGRLSAIIDPTGARTEIEHGSHGEETRTIDPLGRAVARHLDDLGNLAAVELPDGARWEFTHDALSRLVATTDPTGARWEREYDRAGNLTGAVDPTGIRRTGATDLAAGSVRIEDDLASSATRFDPLGRPVAVEQADGSAALVSYDRCGRPVELVDADGGLTRLRRDEAGRVVEVVLPSGATTHHDYDTCGRLAATVDPTGARTTFEYDVDGRLARQVLPTGEVAWAEYDACGRTTARHRPGHGVARYRYDAAGRVVESSDTWFGRRKFRYDAAGQLTEVVNGNGGVTRYAYDLNGRAVSITDPLEHVTRREFDAMNRCTAETDPLGRTLRAGYDPAGRPAWQENALGQRTSWSYDRSGRLASTAVDGTTVSTIERDVRGRSLTMRDHTRGGGQETVHRFEWNARGQLVSRSRDGRTLSWEYDADGRRLSMTTPAGHRTDYTHDAAGRLVAVDHPLLGRAVLEHDAAGRLVAATADGIIQTWEHEDGHVVGHTVGSPEGFTRTDIARDAGGRILSVDQDGETTRYDYDEACQLIEARTDSSVTRWRYDTAGRLVAESTDGATRAYTYDAAGQLTAASSAAGTTRYAYDVVGRRVRTDHGAGRVRELDWSPTGRLSTITDHDGDRVRRTSLHVDATGELAEVEDAELFWDAASPYASGLVQAGETPVVGAGPVTGIGDAWSTPGWRSARSTGADPWSPDVAAGLPAGLGLGPAGEVTIAGLEWLGGRAYDPASRGFLSVDPLDPVAGAGWAGNPYAYAGNDPLHALDPTGLRPVTDAELAAYAAANNGALAAAGDWVSDNWEYLAGGAMVLAGGVLIATGVGGPAGMMLVSAGADTIIQKATTGGVNWGQVAISGAFGAFGGTGAARALGANTLLKQRVVGGMVSGTASGATGGAYTYATAPGPHTPGGFLQSVAVGGGAGFVTGGAASAFSHGVDAAAVRYLPRTHHAPVPGIEPPVIPEPTAGQRIFRVYGGDSGPDGASWSPVNPGAVPGYRDIAGLPSGGVSGAHNTGRFVIEGTLHDPSAVVLQREALPLDGTKGGLPEYIIPNGIDSGAIGVDRVSGVNPEF